MSYIERYRQDHQNPINKALHSVGIPMIVISILAFAIDAFAFGLRYWVWTVGAFVLGWVLQFIGHVFEGKKPSFFSNPIFLLVGPIWWVLKMFGIQPKNKNQPDNKEK